jgi:hypothetical protein
MEMEVVGGSVLEVVRVVTVVGGVNVTFGVLVFKIK